MKNINTKSMYINILYILPHFNWYISSHLNWLSQYKKPYVCSKSKGFSIAAASNFFPWTGDNDNTWFHMLLRSYACADESLLT